MQKTGGEPPGLVAAPVGGADRIPLPGLGGADRGLQDPSPHFFRDVGVQVELVQGLLDLAEGTFRNREVVGILETPGICMLEHRSQGDRRLAAYRLGPAAQDGEQRVDQLGVDDREVAGKLSGQKKIGRRASVPPKDVAGHSHSGVSFKVVKFIMIPRLLDS